MKLQQWETQQGDVRIAEFEKNHFAPSASDSEGAIVVIVHAPG